MVSLSNDQGQICLWHYTRLRHAHIWLTTGLTFAGMSSLMICHTELEQAWQTRVRVAKQRYEESSREFIRLAGDLKNGRYQPPDCSEVLRQARQRECFALDEYMRILQIFSDLVVNGKLPEDPN
jgi:hypothetical protein